MLVAPLRYETGDNSCTPCIMQDTKDTTDIFVLEPSSTERLEYLAEGAANIVYRPFGPPSSPSIEADLNSIPDRCTATPPLTDYQPLMVDPRLEGKLIRLRKNLPTTVPVSTSWEHFHQTITPLFLESEVIVQTLFKTTAQVVKSLNAELRQLESHGSRASKRQGTYLAEDETYGTLITDMSSDEVNMNLELKPKWLVQSPSAPPGSKRCRTCALRAMRRAKQDHHGTDDPSGFCPLKLASDDRAQVVEAVDQILTSSRILELRREDLRVLVADWVLQSSLIKRLKQLQIELDPVGVLEADLTSQSFLTAMTLRDCTLFIKASLSPFLLICLLISGKCRFLVQVGGQ